MTDSRFFRNLFPLLRGQLFYGAGNKRISDVRKNRKASVGADLSRLGGSIQLPIGDCRHPSN
jgi:hypothetical protein